MIYFEITCSSCFRCSSFLASDLALLCTSKIKRTPATYEYSIQIILVQTCNVYIIIYILMSCIWELVINSQQQDLFFYEQLQWNLSISYFTMFNSTYSSIRSINWMYKNGYNRVSVIHINNYSRRNVFNVALTI